MRIALDVDDYIVQDLQASLDEYRKAKLEKESKKIIKEIS